MILALEIILPYFAISIFTFLFLTWYWTKIKTPKYSADHYQYDKNWSKLTIIETGIVQSLTWPVCLPFWMLMVFFRKISSLGHSWINYLNAPKEIIPIKDKYEIEATKAVDALLDPWTKNQTLDTGTPTRPMKVPNRLPKLIREQSAKKFKYQYPYGK